MKQDIIKRTVVNRNTFQDGIKAGISWQEHGRYDTYYQQFLRENGNTTIINEESQQKIRNCKKVQIDTLELKNTYEMFAGWINNELGTTEESLNFKRGQNKLSKL